jgi:hypothetical protein
MKRCLQHIMPVKNLLNDLITNKPHILVCLSHHLEQILETEEKNEMSS